MIESIEGFRDDQELLFCLCETVLPIVQPVYNTGNFFGSGCYDEADVGLSNIGRNMLSLFSLADTILDHSHISEKTSMDILETGFYRNIATHMFIIGDSDDEDSECFAQTLEERP